MEERYGSVAAFGADVRRYLAGESIAAAPPSSWRLLTRLVARNRVASAFAALFLISLVAFSIHSRLQAKRLAREKAEAVEARNDANRRAEQWAALLAFVPDCVHITNNELSSYVAKPGTVLDESTSFSSPNPHYDPEAVHQAQPSSQD